MKTKDVLLAAVVVCGLVLIVKSAQVAATPEFWEWLTTAARLLLESAAVKFLLVSTVALWCLALVIAGYDRAEQRYRARKEAERLEVEGHARSLRARNEIEEATRHDRGPKAA